jgi:hypothetical protein
MRVVIDRDGTMHRAAYEAGIARLRESGLEVIASPAEQLPDRDREIELIIAGLDPADTDRYLTSCADAFNTSVTTGVITYISRGTDDDAQGVLSAFDVDGVVERKFFGDDEVVTVTVAADAMRRVPEAKLHTALEAALNCEVRIVSDASPDSTKSQLSRDS